MSEKNTEKKETVTQTTTVEETAAPVTTLPEKTLEQIEHDAEEAAGIKLAVAALNNVIDEDAELKFQQDEIRKQRELDEANEAAAAAASQAAIERDNAAATAADKKRINDEDNTRLNAEKIAAAKNNIKGIKETIAPPAAPTPIQQAQQQPKATASQINNDGTETPLETTNEKNTGDGVDVFSVILIMISIAAIIGVVIRIVKPKIKTK